MRAEMPPLITFMERLRAWNSKLLHLLLVSFGGVPFDGSFHGLRAGLCGAGASEQLGLKLSNSGSTMCSSRRKPYQCRCSEDHLEQLPARGRAPLRMCCGIGHAGCWQNQAQISNGSLKTRRRFKQAPGNHRRPGPSEKSSRAGT